MSGEDRTRVKTGAPWESQVGYCRAVRAGNIVAVSGTAPVGDDGQVFAPGDAYLQARRCIEIIEKALLEAGSGLQDVIRTRMFVTDVTQWADIGRAHAEAFGEFPPASAMVEIAGLIDPEMIVEIEADAVIPS